jgi:hypothetical protein
MIAFCEAQSRCPKGPSNPLSCEDKLATHASFVGCRDTYEALQTCILQPGVDPCALATQNPPCLDELTAYFTCHVKPENPNCVPSTSASGECNEITSSDGLGKIGFACPNEPNVSNECSRAGTSENGGAVRHFACCTPNDLFQ